MNVTTDRGKCCGAGNCVLVAPAVFDQDDNDGTVLVVTPAPAPEHHDAVREAAEMCPAGAITVD
ncbi:ferredoxin [Actinophytocola xinjiangensis]|uniref:Ferredoxin n=1 Tax=Actinophytocola xinjiangensis TaxID=485602 RepID=A0A7Z0WT63_9PSEU|nr:ferredoxin [Actinophytocola xinjiangensis]OLF12739.1 ferredoxin [Actinophytocola xinjiangensis]